MRKTFVLLSAALFVLLVAGSASAFEQTSLAPSTWSGNVTYITANGTATNSYTLTLNFNFESTDPADFLGGTFSLTTTPAVAGLPFSAIQDGNSLAITAANYTMSGAIIGHHGHHRRGGNAPAVMTIRGRSLADGSMFEGTLTETAE